MSLVNIYINNGDSQITKESYTDCNIIIDDINTSATIKGRGNSTWAYPKKPYNIKFLEKTNLLGLGEHKKWVLLANWMDVTSMRNAIALELANRIMPNVPKYRFVKLYLNNIYQGLYLLCEPIEDFDYLFKFDITDDPDDIYFTTLGFNYKCNIKEPDITLDSPEFLNITNLINDVERLLLSNNFTDVATKIDLRSFIDYLLVQELVGNEELQHPKSAYMYVNKNGKICAGPVWDFDWGTFVADDNNFLFRKYRNYMWYHKLFESQEFINLLKLRWNEVKSIIPSMLSFCEECKNTISQEVEINNEMWPIKDIWNEVMPGDAYPNGDYELDFETSYQNIINWFRNRVNQIDNIITELYATA